MAAPIDTMEKSHEKKGQEMCYFENYHMKTKEKSLKKKMNVVTSSTVITDKLQNITFLALEILYQLWVAFKCFHAVHS